MLDKEYLQLQNVSERHGRTLIQFNEEWGYTEVKLLTWPALSYKKSTKEFIIKVVPYHLTLKVQYIPFIYGGLPVEIKT